MLAQIGPLTTLSEAGATAVGAGVVLGSVAWGIRGLLKRRPLREAERQALFGGYVGGAFGALLAFLDVIFRYSLD